MEQHTPEDHPTDHSHVWLANFMTRDSDNLVFRRFDELYILHILTIQNDLIKCSETLTLHRDSGKQKGLTDVLAKLRILLPEYENALSAYRRMRELHRTPNYVRSVLQAKAAARIEPTLASVYDREDGWADLVSLSGVNKGPIHGFIDSKLQLQKLFSKERQPSVEENLDMKPGAYYRLGPKPGFFYYSENAARLTEQIVIHLVVFCLLVAPILTLPLVTGRFQKVGLIIGCVVLAFLASLLLLERSPMLNFKLALAYAALLVTFLNTSDDT